MTEATVAGSDASSSDARIRSQEWMLEGPMRLEAAVVAECSFLPALITVVASPRQHER